MLRSILITTCAAMAASYVGAAPTITSWPQFRGPGGSGVSPETNVPLEWSADQGVRWKTPLPGRGHSSPVVVDGKIFLTADTEGEAVPGVKPVEHTMGGEPFKHPDAMGANLKHQLQVLCLDAASGKILWSKVAYTGTAFDDRHRKGSYASPTIAAEADRLFAFFGGEGLYCYDFKGTLVWSNRIGGIAQWGLGPGTSPVLSKSSVIIQCDQTEGTNSFVAAIDKRTGKQTWRAERTVSPSWATPVVVTFGGREQVIASGNEVITSYDAVTGKEIWHHEGLNNNAVPSPVVGKDAVYLATGYPKKRVFALALGGSGDLTGTTNLLWSYDRGAAYVPSPILVGSNFYLMSDDGMMTCLDARTGKVRYDAERLPVPARFTASPVAVAGHLLLTSERGDTFVIKEGAKYEMVRKNPIGEKVLASVALADGNIYIRGETNLFCIGPNSGAKKQDGPG